MSDQPRGWGSAGKGRFGEMLDEIMGLGAQRFAETVHRVAPKCGFCGTSTILRCQACGAYVCNVHGFVNVRAWNQYTVVCSECMSHAFDFVEVSPPPNYARPDEMPWHYEDQPWDVLGVRWNASPEEIDKVFKIIARKVHPDRASDDIDRARREREMKKVSAAYQWMKQRAARL
jgi:hypothetical protein